MRFVVATAFRRALATLVLVLGLLWVVFIFLDSRGGHLDPPFLFLSPWDFPIAIAIGAATVLTAALIYPKRRSSLISPR
jgi:hypothetical protein